MGQKVGQYKLYIKCIKNIKFGKAVIKKNHQHKIQFGYKM